MAIYRFETRFIGRADSALGRSVVAAAAYRAGERLKDERYDANPNYRRRAAGVAHTEIVAPDNAPSWMADRESLWNGVEKAEKRKDSRLAREFIIALPHELDAEQRRALVMGFAREELTGLGMTVDIAIHAPKTGLNHHAHLLCTTREIDAAGFGGKVRAWDKDYQLDAWREAWEVHCNAALEKAGLDMRVDRRSLEDRGIDWRKPEPKLGVVGAALEKKGVESTRRRALRETHYDNQLAGAIRDIERGGEVYQAGAGETWWERAGVALRQWREQAASRFVELLKDETSGGGWRAHEEQRRAARDTERGQPEREIG